MLQVWNGAYDNTVKNRAIAAATGRVLDDIYLKSIREEHSLAYSVNSMIMLEDMPEPFFILQTIAPVTPEKTDSAMALVDEGLKQLASQPAPADILAKAKEQMLKGYENNLRENSYWQNLAVENILFGRDGFTGYKEAIEAVTPEDVQAFVRDVVLKQQNRLNLLMKPAE
jgi:zinc protease